MENIGDFVASVLSDPDAMEKLRQTAGQLGIDADALLGGQTEPSEAAPAPKPSAASFPADPAAAMGSDGMLSVMSKIAPLLGKLNEEDDMTRLLHALRPYLSGSRLKRAEDADKLLTLLRLLPLLREAGL